MAINKNTSVIINRTLYQWLIRINPYRLQYPESGLYDVMANKIGYLVYFKKLSVSEVKRIFHFHALDWRSMEENQPTAPTTSYIHFMMVVSRELQKQYIP